MKTKFVNRVGQTVGELFIKEVLFHKSLVNGKTERQYKCVCICKKEIQIRASLLSPNVKRQQINCGHDRVKRCKYAQVFSANSRRLPSKEKAKGQVISTYKSGAKRRNLSFQLTNQQVFDLVEQNCSYCGSEPKNISKVYVNKKHKIWEEYLHNGIDRVDNTKGYELDNSITCCIICNKAKDIMSKQDFLSWIEQVYNHSIKPKNLP